MTFLLLIQWHILLTLTVTPVSVMGRGSTNCQDGWLGFKGSCYLFGHGDMHFTEAEQFCRQHYAHLVHVNNSEENEYLKDRMRDLQKHFWWLGITDEAIEGRWRWFDTDTEATFLEFVPEDSKHNNQDCAIFSANFDYRWTDAPCTSFPGWPLCETTATRCTEHEIVG